MQESRTIFHHELPHAHFRQHYENLPFLSTLLLLLEVLRHHHPPALQTLYSKRLLL
jgi:hypothetical protein